MKKYTFPFFPFTSKKLLKLFSTISRRLGASSFFFSFLSAIYGSNPSEVGDLKPHLCFFFVSSLFALACLLHITGCVFALMHSDRTVWLQQRLSKSVERITIFLFFFFWYYGANAWEAPLPRRRAPAARQCVAMTFLVFFSVTLWFTHARSG